MSIERAVRASAGVFILASLLLATWFDVRFVWFTAFVGANLLLSAVTRFCPLAYLFQALGLKPEGTSFRLRSRAEHRTGANRRRPSGAPTRRESSQRRRAHREPPSN
jgi:hypothetical protein